jgi:hypothetical protein
LKEKIYFIVIVFLFISCGSKNEKINESKKNDTGHVKAIDTNTSALVDTIYPEEQKIEIGSIPALDFQGRLKLLKTKYEVNYTEIQPENVHIEVLDRFTCEKKFIFHLRKKMPLKNKPEKIFPIANFHAYIYKDSAQCANAINNWYNCFGSDCAQVTPGTNTTIKSNPGFYIINQTSIICLDYVTEHSENNWNALINHMRNLFETGQSTIITVKPGGKLFWEQ